MSLLVLMLTIIIVSDKLNYYDSCSFLSRNFSTF